MLKIAQISRNAFNTSYQISKSMKEKFIKFIGNNISFEDEKVKKDFSFWIKTLEKEKNRFTLYESILKQEKPYLNGVSGQAEKYLINLY